MSGRRTQLVLLGTGTPNACPEAAGPAVALVVDGRSYLVDFGPGVVRQAAKAYHRGVDGLAVKGLCRAFCTHLHSDHTAGLADLILTPWVLEREEPLQLYGPKGLDAMAQHILAAYQVDIDFRIHGFEQANSTGCRVDVHQVQPGLVYQDDLVRVEAFPVDHGTLECYGYRFTTPDRVIVVSGDTAPVEAVARMAQGADVLLHEVFYAGGLAQREPKWRKYHESVHTSSRDLARIAARCRPKLLVTYHRIYHMDIQDNRIDLAREIARREALILQEIREGYTGPVAMGHDLDIY